MKSLLLIIASFVVTILAWGVYGPVLHWGQLGMTNPGAIELARWRPFVCVGLAYFAIGVIVPSLLLKWKGEQGDWTFKGVLLSLAAGALGALGALGIILAFNFGGRPVVVMPLVFGGAPVVNSFITIYLAKRMREIGPVFLAGLVMVLLGSITVMLSAPRAEKHPAPESTTASEKVSNEKISSDTARNENEAETSNGAQDAAEKQSLSNPPGGWFSRFILRLASVAVVILCWGAYGPTLHKGQAAMHQSRLRPLVCVGLAYFAIAVIVPNLLLGITAEASQYHFVGTLWSLAAGLAGAIGALGIILAFNFGGKPVYVMPLVFGGAPVVNTMFTTTASGRWGEIEPLFLAGLILVIAGAAMTLLFAPKGKPPDKIETESTTGPATPPAPPPSG